MDQIVFSMLWPGEETLLPPTPHVSASRVVAAVLNIEGKVDHFLSVCCWDFYVSVQ